MALGQRLEREWEMRDAAEASLRSAAEAAARAAARDHSALQDAFNKVHPCAECNPQSALCDHSRDCQDGKLSHTYSPIPAPRTSSADGCMRTGSKSASVQTVTRTSDHRRSNLMTVKAVEQEREKSSSREAAGKLTAAEVSALEAELGELKRQVALKASLKLSSIGLFVLTPHDGVDARA